MSNDPFEQRWEDVAHVESWAGEIRVNLIRLIAIVLFYARHLFVFVVWPDHSPAALAYHTRVTIAVAVWAAAVIALHWRLTARRVPAWLKFASAGFDAGMITLICCLACAQTGSPRTPLVLLFFPLIATAPLRMSLRLVYMTTAAAGVGYLILLAYYAWYRVGFSTYYSAESLSNGVRIPRSEEVMYLLAMLVAGLLAGQMVRQMRRVVLAPVIVSSATPQAEGKTV